MALEVSFTRLDLQKHCVRGLVTLGCHSWRILQLTNSGGEWITLQMALKGLRAW